MCWVLHVHNCGCVCLRVSQRASWLPPLSFWAGDQTWPPPPTMSGLAAKIVCQVSGVAWLPTGWLMKGLHGGVRVGLAGGKGEGAVLKRGWWWGGGVDLLLCCFSIALLYQTSCWFTAPSPKQQTEATQGPKLGRTLAAELPPVPPPSGSFF